MQAQPQKLLYGQRRLLDDKTKDEHAIVGGVGSGKTKCGPRWHHKRCIDNKDSVESIVSAPNYRLLKNRCLAEYRLHLQSMGMREGRRADYRVYESPSDMRLVFHWGHTVHFLSANNPESLVSYNASHIWIDEPAVIDEESILRIIARLRCPDAAYRQILYTGTPEGLNWFYERFHPDKVHRIHGTPFSEGENQLVLHASSYNNRYLPQSYLRLLEREYAFDPAYFSNYVLGEWTSLSQDRFYHHFNPQLHIGDYPAIHELKNMTLTWDKNIGKMTWVVLQPLKNTYLAVKDNGGRGRDINDACQQFIDIFPPGDWGQHNISVMGDPTLWSREAVNSERPFYVIRENLKKYYPRLHIDAPDAMPSVESRHRTTNRILAENRLLMDRNCKKLIQSAKTAEHDGRGKVKKSSTENITHAMEAVDMALVALEPPQITREFRGIK